LIRRGGTCGRWGDSLDDESENPDAYRSLFTATRLAELGYGAGISGYHFAETSAEEN
jgi:hypothetical protein